MTTSEGHLVNRKAAAAIEGCSVDTIKRRVKDGHYPGAVPPDKTDTGEWLIPVSQLRQYAGATVTTTEGRAALADPRPVPPTPPAGNQEAITLAVQLLAVLTGAPQ